MRWKQFQLSKYAEKARTAVAVFKHNRVRHYFSIKHDIIIDYKNNLALPFDPLSAHNHELVSSKQPYVPTHRENPMFPSPAMSPPSSVMSPLSPAMSPPPSVMSHLSPV
eukprot:94994-Ditylum_brightwellii.AAC.1